MRTITVTIGSISLDVTGYYNEGCPGLWTHSNGDPGYPEDPPSFDIVSVMYCGKDITQVIEEFNNLFYQLARKADSIIYEDLLIHIENLVLTQIKD